VSRGAVVGAIALLLVVPAATGAESIAPAAPTAKTPCAKLKRLHTRLPARCRTKPTRATTTALFDGRAALVNYLDPIGGSGHQAQDPIIWDCLCYANGNVKLVPDARYGKAYRYYTDDSSWNGWGYDPGPNVGTSGLAKSRPQGLGHWDWYALAVKIPSRWMQPTWALIFEPNFPGWTSPPVGLNLSPRNSAGRYCWRYSTACRPWFNLIRTVGVVGSISHEQNWLRPVKLGKWTEFVIGINWKTDSTGAYRVYSRVPANGKTTFTLNAFANRVRTYQTKAGTATPATTADIQLLYEGTEPTNGWPVPLWGNTIYHRGFQRFSDEASAFAAFRQRPRKLRP
jgi:hypothetical protein